MRSNKLDESNRPTCNADMQQMHKRSGQRNR